MAVSVTPEQLTIAGSASEPDASTLPYCRPRGLGRRTSSGQPRHALDPTGFPPRSATPRTCRQSGSDQGGIPCSHSAMLNTVPAGLLVLFAHLVRSSRLGRCSLRSTTGIRPKCCQTRHYLEREKCLRRGAGLQPSRDRRRVLEVGKRPGDEHRLLDGAAMADGRKHQTFRQPAASPSTHSFTRRPDSVSFRNSRLANPWTYSGPDVPSSGDEKTRLNLWLFEGKARRMGRRPR
jgi:hypothetical protein